MTAQEYADLEEAKDERIFELWRGWGQEQRRSEAVRHEQHGGHSPSRFAARRRLWAVCGAILVIALAAALVQIH